MNSHVIFNVLCKYCQSLIFLFLLITIFCTLWKKINLKNKTMNCFLFYFQQPIKSQPLIKCRINAKYHSSGQQSIPNLTDGITVNRRGQSIFGDYQVYIKLSLSTKSIIKYKYFHKIKPNFIKMTIWQKLLRNTVFMHVLSFGWLFPRFSSLSDDFGFPLLVYSPQWPHHVSPAYLRRLLFSSAQGDRQVLARGLKVIKVIV